MAYNRDRSWPTTGWVKSLRYTKNTWSCIMTSTGYYRLLYNQDRLLLTTLYEFYPVGSSPSEYTKNTRLSIMTSTGHDWLLYNQDRSLPPTLYAFYPVGSSPPEYTENTRSCIMTSTGHDRLLYLCSTQELGLRSTGSVSNTPTRPCFAHRPDYSSVFTYGLGLTQYNCSGNIRMISGYRTLAYRASHNIIVLNCL